MPHYSEPNNQPVPNWKNKTKTESKFINNRTDHISLEPKKPEQNQERMDTWIFKIKIIYLQILIICNYQITKYPKYTIYKLNYPIKTNYSNIFFQILKKLS